MIILCLKLLKNIKKYGIFCSIEGVVCLKIQRYKHDSICSYALGATLTFELLKNSPHINAG